MEAWTLVAVWAGFVATGVAAVYARSQARSARRALRETCKAREAAQDQARSSRESAELARANLNMAERPTFELSARVLLDVDIVEVTAIMRDGPPVTVRISWENNNAEHTQAGVEIWSPGSRGQTRYFPAVKNTRRRFQLTVPAAVERGKVKVVISCSESLNGEHGLTNMPLGPSLDIEPTLDEELIHDPKATGREWQIAELVEWRRI